jgi:REP element-mobilizing transposase RayT
MKYSPQIPHRRRSIRLKGYDYSLAGAYFITICCENLECRFGNIENEEMILNEFGNVANDEWMKLPERFANCETDVFQIMPNHMHGIIVLNDVGATLAVAQNDVGATLAVAHESESTSHDTVPRINIWGENLSMPEQIDNTANGATDNITFNNNPINNRATARVAPTTNGDIVGAYKSLVTNKCIKLYKSKNQIMGKLWQRNYFEHIIRNEKSYQNITDYIISNPRKWNEDKFFVQ